MSKEYTGYSPENIIFLGAGATAALMPPTSGIAKFITNLTKKDKSLNERIENSCDNFSQKHKDGLKSLLLMLGDEGNVQKETEIKKRAEKFAIAYQGNKAEIIKNLHKLSELYNWECFKTIAHHSETDSDEVISIMTLYTQFDILINSGAGFKTKKKFFYPYEVVAARNCIVLISNLLLYANTNYNLENHKDIKEKYESFFNILAELMRIEGIEKENIDYESREFILFSYAIISFNWDPVLLGMLFNSHKEINHSNKAPYLGKRCQKLRLFNDFGIVIGSLRMDNDDKEPKLWYQGHESIAKRLNDNEYPNRLMRVGKYLFPHGSSAFRICPVCKKTNFVVRNLGTDYLNYYGPGILPEFGDFYSDELLTQNEIEEFKNGKFDAVQCYECGNIMQLIDTPLIFQTAVKGTKPPLLEEAVNEMLVLIKKAKHLIFNGYSLPPDDVLYRSMIKNTIADNYNRSDEINDKLKISVILYDNSAKDKTWYSQEETKELVKNGKIDQYVAKNVNGFINLFQNCEIRFCFKGFPDVLGNNITEESVKEFLNFENI